MRFSTVLFDLDGTLIDSGPIILASFRHATRAVLAREIPDDQLLAYVGGWSLRDQMRRLDEERVEELVQAYRDHNEPLHAELEAFAGIERVLERLHEQGRRLGLVTAKRRPTVELAFAVLPLERYFSTVVTSEETERHKPHPQPIQLALERLGEEPEQAAYVGDSPFDVAAAKAAGLFAVAVAWGGMHPLERVLAEGPDAVVHRAEELLGVL